jgi:hypothetical protein
MLSSVEGLPKFQGHAGVLKGNRAYRIAKVLPTS